MALFKLKLFNLLLIPISVYGRLLYVCSNRAPSGVDSNQSFYITILSLYKCIYFISGYFILINPQRVSSFEVYRKIILVKRQ
jgi:hypothetical protein